jgi:enolase-phosphatase E1
MAATIRHVLLDIEGTTCPVQFVSEVLFPYAAEQMGTFLDSHQRDPAIADLLRQVEKAWDEDPDPAAQALRKCESTVPQKSETLGTESGPTTAPPPQRVIPYMLWLIQVDRKLAPLKELQGLIWEEGYRSGALHGPLYEDVPPALHRWRQEGLILSVYSSGSIRAQQLLYQYSNAGDLRSLFNHWFDTRSGSKFEAKSYERICEEMACACSQVLFISDSYDELRAASAAGLAVLHSDRDPQPSQPLHQEPLDRETIHQAAFASIHSFASLDPRSTANQQKDKKI